MPVQMILCHVQHNSCRVAQVVDRFQLKARKFKHPHLGQVVFVQCGHQGGQRSWTDIARRSSLDARALKHVLRQCSNGRFTVGARNAQHFWLVPCPLLQTLQRLSK